MLSRILISLIFLLVPLFSLAEGEKVKIVAFGDSLTAGYGLASENSYPAKLEKLLSAEGFNVQIVNMGISGETSAGGWARLESVISEKPAIVLLGLGANDMLRGQDPVQTRSNLEHIIYELLKNKIKIVLLGMKAPLNYGADYANSFNSIYKEIAKKYDVELKPFMLEDIALKPDLNLSDGIHPNEKGYDIMVNNIAPYVKKLLK